jgi:diphthine synthase
MLYLISTGLCFDLTKKAIKAIKNCEEIWLDSYTTKIEEKEKLIEIIKNETGSEKILKEVNREMLENSEIFNIAKEKNIAVLCQGDIFFATTHIVIYAEAKKRGIEVKVVHNAGIINAVFKTGLSPYKFGQTVTLPKWFENYKPVSWLERAIKNKIDGLHTIILIDPQITNGNELYEIFFKSINEIEQKNAYDKTLNKELPNFNELQSFIFNNGLIIIENAGCEEEKLMHIKNIEKLKGLQLNKNITFVLLAELNKNEQELIELILDKD